MPLIRRLPENLVNRIAAGEVVERPSSALKEVVENAIDAGATRIAVKLVEGGLGSLEVTDDGCGMTPDEMGDAFTEWNKGELDSYLIEITSQILKFKDTDGTPLVVRQQNWWNEALYGLRTLGATRELAEAKRALASCSRAATSRARPNSRNRRVARVLRRPSRA